MARTPKLYRRLPGTGYRRVVSNWVIVLLFFVLGIFALLFRGRRTQLWQGEEHLLLVESDGYREYYKRFNYRDIQAFIVRRTQDGKIVNGVTGGVALLFAGFMVWADDPGAKIFLGCVAGVLAFFVLVNVLYGPTCKTFIRTAVQTEELPSLCRFRRARKVIARLRPLISAAQGELPPEDISARMRELSQSPGAQAGQSGAPAEPSRYVIDDLNAPPRIIS